MTLVDLGVLVAASAVVLAIPIRERPGQIAIPWPWFKSALILLENLNSQVGLVLALVVLHRRGRYGGPVRPAERLALAMGAFALLRSLPDLTDAMYAHFIAIGAMTMHWGSGVWTFAEPLPNFDIARLTVASVATLILLERLSVLVSLRRSTQAGSRLAAALSVVSEFIAWLLFLWGPCTIVMADLPSLIDPMRPDFPTRWDWLRVPAAFISQAVRLGPWTLIWGCLFAATAHAWVWDRRTGRSWFWTEWVSLIVGGMTAICSLILTSEQGIGRGPLWVGKTLGAGGVAWWGLRRWKARRDRVPEVIAAAPGSVN